LKAPTREDKSVDSSLAIVYDSNANKIIIDLHRRQLKPYWSGRNCIPKVISKRLFIKLFFPTYPPSEANEQSSHRWVGGEQPALVNNLIVSN